MDALSVLSILLRRWYVTVPLVAVGVVGVVGYLAGLPPTYRADAGVLVLGPSQKVVGIETIPGNPLLRDDRGVGTVVGAVRSVMDSQPVREAVDQAGLASDYVIESTDTEQQFAVSARSEDEAVAIATVDNVLNGFEERLTDLEDSFGSNAFGESLQVRQIQAPTAVAEDGETTKAAVALTAGVLLLVAVLVVVLDAIAVRSGRVRREKHPWPTSAGASFPTQGESVEGRDDVAASMSLPPMPGLAQDDDDRTDTHVWSGAALRGSNGQPPPQRGRDERATAASSTPPPADAP